MKSIIFVLLAAFAACVLSSEPRCQYSDTVNKVYFDLNPAGEADVTVTQTNFDFVINPCAPLTTVAPVGTACPAGSFVCQVNTGTSTAAYTVATNISSITSATGTSVVLNLNGGTYCSGNGNYREITITFTCGTTLGAPVYVSESACHYYFNWASTVGCKLDAPPNATGGLSIGSILCIIFFVSIFLYFAIGMAFKYKTKEARGAEMVPNIDFWRDLPNLIKDGFAFTTMKIKGMMGSS